MRVWSSTEMQLRILIMGLLRAAVVWGWKKHPMEKYHNPGMFTTTMNPVVDVGTGTERMETRFTPDFRLPEPMLEPYDESPIETHRPYRASPHYRMTSFYPGRDYAEMYGCYCTTVFKRYRLLAGCAILTTRHLLTTASSTELVLRRYRKFRSLDNILGAWYDIENKVYNSSMYTSPSRIHYHPLFTMPKDVNRSHPFPVMFDLSIWAATFRFWKSAVICNRGSPAKSDQVSGGPSEPSIYNMFGFQFMKAYDRRPLPWFKYTVRVSYLDGVIPCPKAEWGWYHCYLIGSWAPLGLDMGSACHRKTRSRSRNDGMVSMLVLSMKLRSLQILGYFIDVNTHKALDFFYNAYNGKLPYQWLDFRFDDTFNKAPLVKEGFVVKVSYPWPEQLYRNVECCRPEKQRPGYD